MPVAWGAIMNALHTLLEQADAARDAALAEHQRAVRGQQAAEHQAEQLVDYRREYVQRFGSRFGRAGAVELLRCYQGFMGRLDDAVSQQKQIVAQAVSRVRATQAALQAAELRAASVRKLIERRLAEAAQAESRREQKASDEFASRVAWQRGAAWSAL